MDEGRLQFAIEGDLIMDLDLADIEVVHYPWYYFDGGVKLESAGESYRFSFVRPNGAEVAVNRGLGEVGSPLALLGAADKLHDIGEGRTAGKRWKAVLPERKASG